MNTAPGRSSTACSGRSKPIPGPSKNGRRLMQTGMKQDFSWEHSAKEYVKVYRKAMRK